MLRLKDILAWVGAAALGGLFVAGLMGAAQRAATKAGNFKVVEAESFILRDRHGVARGRFESRAENDEALVCLMDTKGIKHFSAALQAKGGVSLSVGADGAPGQIILARTPDGEASLMMTRKESEIAMLSHSNGDSEFVLVDQLRTRRASLGIKDDGASTLKLYNAEGRVSSRVPARDD